MTQEIAHKIMRNTFFVFCGRAWFLAMSLILTPYLLGGLGPAVYGVWVLVDSLVRTVGLVDFGFATSFVKFVAEHDAEGDVDSVGGVLAAGLVFYALVGLVLLGVGLGLVDVIIGFFNLPAGETARARLVLQIAIAASVCANFIGAYQSIINGLQRMEVSNGIMVLMSLFFVGGCVVVVEGNKGIVGLAVAQLVTQIIGIALSVYYAHRLYPGLRVNFPNMKRQMSTLFRYGINVHLSNVALLVNVHFDKLIVNKAFDSTYVAYYDVGARPPATARSFASLTLSALTPAAAEIEVREGQRSLYGLFVQTTRYVSAVAFPLFLGLAATAVPLIEAWVGEGYGKSAVVLMILSTGYLVSSFAGPVTPFVQGMGRPDLQRNAEALSLVLNVVLSLSLLALFGFYGAAAGTALAMALSSCWYLYSFHRLMRRPMTAFVRRCYLVPFACAVAAAGSGAAMSRWLHPIMGPGRLAALATLVGGALVVLVVYAVLVWRLRFFTEAEIAQVRRFLGFAWLRGVPAREMRD